MARKAIKIKFKEEVMIGGKTLKEVTMRPPKGKDLKVVGHLSDQYERDMTLASNLCGLNASIEDFDEMDMAEVQQFKMALISFL